MTWNSSLFDAKSVEKGTSAFSRLCPGPFLNHATPSPPPPHPSFADVHGQLSDSTPPALPLCQQTLWHTTKVRPVDQVDTHVFIHACTHAGITVLRQLSWTYMSIKQGRLTGLSNDTGFALQSQVTIIGVSFKASASPGRKASKLTGFAGFLLVECTGQCSTLSFTYTNSGFRKALNTAFPLPLASP